MGYPAATEGTPRAQAGQTVARRSISLKHCGQSTRTSRASSSAYSAATSREAKPGIYYFTNRSGSWKGRYLGAGDIPRLALGGRKAHVAWAKCYRSNSCWKQTVHYATNRSGAWTAKTVLPASPLQACCSIAVSGDLHPALVFTQLTSDNGQEAQVRYGTTSTTGSWGFTSITDPPLRVIDGDDLQETDYAAIIGGVDGFGDAHVIFLRDVVGTAENFDDPLYHIQE